MLKQLQQQVRIAPVRFLLALRAGADLGGIADPQLVAPLRQQPLEPLRLPAGFQSHANWPRQPQVKLLRLFALLAVAQPLFGDLPGALEIVTFGQNETPRR